MKKVLAIVFLGSLVAVGCSKKADNQLQDSNIMLDEPKTAVSGDSATVAGSPALDQGSESARVDSATAKKQTAEVAAKPADTAKAKK
jgi:uncharacterized protein YcfL